MIAPSLLTTDVDERINRAWMMADGSRERCASILTRWARVLSVLDPTVADRLRATAQGLLARERGKPGSGSDNPKHGRAMERKREVRRKTSAERYGPSRKAPLTEADFR